MPNLLPGPGVDWCYLGFVILSLVSIGAGYLAWKKWNDPATGSAMLFLGLVIFTIGAGLRSCS